MSAPHAITRLTLENFRNYSHLQLAVSHAPVVLRGRNGAGKTNILEAISLLAPGRGLRHARLREMDALRTPEVARHPGLVPGSPSTNDALLQEIPVSLKRTGMTNQESAPWVVAAQLITRDEETHIGTGRDGEAASEKRIIKVNGEKIRGHAALAAHACIQWLTPAMDQVFVEGGSARRKLLDRIVFGFVPEHAARVSAYEAAMRERNTLLRAGQRAADPYWLSVIEQQMAEHGVAMTSARLEVVARLQAALAEEISHFPRALLSLNGTLEAWLAQGESALEVEAKFAERLAALRGMDGASGRCGEGPHRSALSVMHREKNMTAERCSTGEQKALLLSIILGAARARAAWCGLPPILLLDEVIAHLDVDKRASLFDLIRASAIQAWMTGTDAADFQGLQGNATVLEIDGARVVNQVEI